MAQAEVKDRDQELGELREWKRKDGKVELIYKEGGILGDPNSSVVALILYIY